MPLAADEVLLNHFPSGKNIIKNGRAMLAPTTIDFCADETATGGTDKSVFSVTLLRRDQYGYCVSTTGSYWQNHSERNG